MCWKQCAVSQAASFWSCSLQTAASSSSRGAALMRQLLQQQRRLCAASQMWQQCCRTVCGAGLSPRCAAVPPALGCCLLPRCPAWLLPVHFQPALAFHLTVCLSTSLACLACLCRPSMAMASTCSVAGLTALTPGQISFISGGAASAPAAASSAPAQRPRPAGQCLRASSRLLIGCSVPCLGLLRMLPPSPDVPHARLQRSTSAWQLG